MLLPVATNQLKANHKPSFPFSFCHNFSNNQNQDSSQQSLMASSIFVCTVKRMLVLRYILNRLMLQMLSGTSIKTCIAGREPRPSCQQHNFQVQTRIINPLDFLKLYFIPLTTATSSTSITYHIHHSYSFTDYPRVKLAVKSQNTFKYLQLLNSPYLLNGKM